MKPPRVAMAILSKGWGIASGSLLIVAAPYFLSRIELGVFYSFGSLLALQIFFDLGLSYVVMQVAAADFAHVDRDGEGRVQNCEAAHRLAALVRLLRKWYGGAALLFFLSAATAGWLFFSSSKALTISWQGPWVCLCAVAAINLYLSPFLSIDEASGQVHLIARLRLVSNMLGTALFLGGMASGLHLWAVPLNLLPLALGAIWWLTSRRSNALVLTRLIQNEPQASIAAHKRWREDILPFQWRLSLSWISGYFIYQLITPTVFKVVGPEQAGRFGLGLAICNSLLGLGAAWMNAIAPSLVHAIERKDWFTLNQMMDKHMLRSTLLLTVPLSIAIAAPTLAGEALPKVAERLPTTLDMTLLAASAMANHLVYAMATWLRAFRIERLLAPSLASAGLTVALMVWASHHSANNLIAAYAASILFVLLPWTAVVYRTERRLCLSHP
jgi:hypothetical protein